MRHKSSERQGSVLLKPPDCRADQGAKKARCRANTRRDVNQESCTILALHHDKSTDDLVKPAQNLFISFFLIYIIGDIDSIEVLVKYDL
jgi:hypothetical protein